MTDIPDKRYFRPDELARELHVCIETVRRWIRDDQIRHLHVNTRVMIPRDEFIRAIESGPRARRV